MFKILKHMNYVKEIKCNFKYNPDAKSSRFKSFVKEILNYDNELYEYVHRMFGYAVTGSCREQKLFVLQGQGSNGKSMLMDAICYTIGDYHGLFPVTTILKSFQSAGQPTPELVPLINKRLAYCSELKADNAINDAVIKQLTGGEKMLVRKMRKEFAQVDITFKIFLDTNFTLNFKHYDYAIERGVVIVPFKRRLEGTQKDSDLIEKLKEDGEYILKWLINGSYKYYCDGLEEPSSITNANAEFRTSNDSIGSFTKNALETDYGNQVKSSDLYNAYLEYCKENTFSPMDIKTFSQTLVNRGFRKKLKNAGTFFADISLIDFATTRTTD